MKSLLYLSALAMLCASCHKDGMPGSSSKGIVYLETNDAGGNAILAYYHKDDTTLAALPGSPFATGGTGIANPSEGLGPDDSDTQLKITADGTFLLAVNPGSNNISVFRIGSGGALSAVPGSPFASGGPTPESIDLKGNYVYVVNKGVNDAHTPALAPNYTVFTLDNAGKLTPVAASTIETSAGSSPAQALVSNDGKFLFGTDFLGFMLSPVQGSLRSFTIDNNGKLTAVAGTPIVIPGAGGALGLWQHPYANILYAGFPLQGKVAVYNINPSSGALTLQTTVDAGLAACWIRTGKNGKFLYALNSGENTISMYNTASPAAPAALGKLTLKKSGPAYMGMGLTFTTSEDFSFGFSADGKFCYVISQHTNTDLSIGNYNYLHILKVQADGTLLEPGDPLQLPVAASVRPQGVVTYVARG